MKKRITIMCAAIIFTVGSAGCSSNSMSTVNVQAQNSTSEKVYTAKHMLSNKNSDIRTQMVYDYICDET